MQKAKYLTLALAIFIASTLSNQALAAVVVAADHSGGYSNSVLDAVVKKWQPPMDGVERTIRIMVMLSGDGNVEDCTAIKDSGSAAADQAACDAVRSIGKFQAPPYGLPMDVFLSFWVSKSDVSQTSTDASGALSTPAPVATPEATKETKSPATEAKQEAKKQPTTTHKPVIQENNPKAVLDEDDYYVKMVMRKIGPNVVFPPDVPTGELSTSLSVKVDGSGNIGDIKISKSSGSEELDNALVKATEKTGKVNAPPKNEPRDLFLTFIIKNK